MMSSYPVEGKRLKKWSKKMWLHLINTCFQRSDFTQKTRRKLSPLEFRSRLISHLVEKYGHDTEAVRKGGIPSTGENPFRLVERHFPSYVSATEKSQMLHVDVLYVKIMGPKKKVGMNVYAMT